MLPTKKITAILLLLTALMTAPLLAQDEPTYEGKPLAFWLNVLRNNDEDMMPLALDAIRTLGPKASAAVPALMQVLARPFSPVQLGKDSDEIISEKLYDLEVRSSAIDALAAIGKDAAPATMAVFQWALAVRVVPAHLANQEEYERFVDLATLEVEYRIRVMDAIEKFGEPATTSVAKLLLSADPEKRKLAVIMLGTDVLPIAGDLLKSSTCEEQHLGLSILRDLEPLVARSYIAYLDRMIVCGELATSGDR